MMGISNSRYKLLVPVLIFFGGIICLIRFEAKMTSSVYLSNYILDSICLAISCFLLLRLHFHKRLDMFEPITVIAVLYVVMYFFTPLYDLCIGKYMWYGYDLFDYGPKSTTIAFLGFLCFYFFYTHTFTFGKKYRNYSIARKKKSENRKKFLIVTVIMYTISLIGNIFYIVRVSGNSLVYTLSLGLLGSGNTALKTDVSIGFISMFAYCLPAATLLYWEYGNKKLLKILSFVLMFMLQVARGFRFLVIAIVITFCCYYYLKKQSRPKLRTIVFVALVVAIPIVIMTVFRNSIRAGAGMDLAILSMERIAKSFDEAIWENFRIYKNFYALTGKVPSMYPYVYGRQMIIGTLIMFIPRAIWPNKLPTQAGVGLEYIVGSTLKGTGQAYPNLGEYYYAFGTLGVIVCMSIYGIWAKKIKKKLMYSQNAIDIIEYSVLLGANLQLIIRGYTPSNFWYLVFSIFPIVVIRFFSVERR